MNNLIPTNEWQARIGRKNSSLCTFCNATPETMDHLFFTCPKIAAFWNRLRRRVTDFNPVYFLTGKISLFGITEPKSQATSAFNFLNLLDKQFILRCKYQESIPSLKLFNNYILSYRSTQEDIAKKKKKIEKHMAKWQNINKYFRVA